jgi:hypothetical protein
MSVQEAIVLAGRVRLRPILITALALVIGSMVLLSDPIFQGMAVSLLFGSLVATFLTLVVIPLGCVSARKHFLARPPHGGAAPPAPEPEPTPPPAPAPARPPRLERRSETAGEPAPPPGRPPRLSRKSEGEAAPPPAVAPAPSGRPPRLMKKSEHDAEIPEPPAEAGPSEEPKA